MKLAVVIPAHNEEKTIGRVIDALPKKIKGVDSIQPIVVNDASTDRTIEAAQGRGALVLSHKVNLGAGGATITGLTASKRFSCNMAVTLDGDGQHDPNDIPALIDVHQKTHSDLVIGSRFLSSTISSMPPVKVYGNKIMNGITYIFSRYPVTDSQSGFRLFGPNFLNNLHLFSTGGYEFCSEAIIIANNKKFLIREVPIQTIYFNERRGQNPLNGVNILLRLFYRTVTG